MDTKDKTPPAGAIEEDLSAEEKGMHEEAKRLEKLQSVGPDADLPKVQSEQSTI